MENHNEEQKYEALIDLEKPLNVQENSEETENKQTVNPTDTVEKASSEPSKLKKYLFIELNPGFSYANLYCYYLVQFGYVMAFAFIDACQDYLLESKDYDYKIDHKETGSVNGNILLFDTLYLVINFLTIYFIVKNFVLDYSTNYYLIKIKLKLSF
jgi:hypothetical protein